jgi:hypothetical protein
MSRPRIRYDPEVLIIAVSDLMFEPRISAAAAALNLPSRSVQSAQEFDAALGSASGAVIDLHDRSIDALEAISRASEAGVPVLAFGRHTEPGLLRAARDAGAGIVVPRSQLVEELPQLIERLTRAVKH